MKKRGLTGIIAMTLLAVALPVGVAAQDATQNHNAKHHHYKLIDLGTLGGPQSVIYEQTTRALNNNGTVVYNADTSNFDPNPYFLYPDSYFDPYIQHVSQWRGGVKTDLGSLPGDTSANTQWINERGTVVGGSTNGQIDSLTGYPEVIATLWKAGKIYSLGTLGGNGSAAFAVNDRGLVVGWASNTIPDPFASAVTYVPGATQAHAVLWQDGAIQDLGTLGGPDSAAYFVNERGQIAGQSLTNSNPNATTGYPTQDPFLWDKGKMIDLGTLGGTYGYPLSMNNSGQVVGVSNLAGDQNQHQHAFLWDKGVLKDLGTLGGTFSEAWQINDAGEVAGHSARPDGQVHPFLWKNGAMIDLGSVGQPCTYAIGLNSPGQVVGASYDCNFGGYNAFLWEHGSIVDLNNLIPASSDLHLGQAININNRGEIVGTALLPGGDPQYYSAGYLHAFLLIPCDENHADVEGCDYDEVEVAAVSPNSHSGHVFPGAQGLLHSRRTNRH
ncbi:MAG: hypothetical protein ACHQIK_18270 [Candidatus Acidiferrales bacterium]